MSRRLVWLFVVLGVVVLAGGGYLGLVAPRRDAAARAAADVEDARRQLEVNHELAARLADAEKVRAADLFQLERAIPDRLAVQNVLLQLTQLAQDSGIKISSVAPRSAVAGGGFQKTPIDVSFDGTYASVSRFLAALRQLVVVRDGHVASAGPLFTIDHVGLATRVPGLPALQANVTVNAYSFDQTAPATPATPTPTPTPGVTS